MNSRMVGLRGLQELQQALATIKNVAGKKAAKAGINAGLVPLVSAMRAAVNATNASPEMKRAARKTLAKRLQRKGGETIGKAGFGVGKQTAAKTGKASARAALGRKGGGRGGVGISAANVHWPIFGTEDRVQTKTGRSTGRMPSQLPGVIAMAASACGPAMLEAAREKITQVLAREAAKAKKG